MKLLLIILLYLILNNYNSFTMIQFDESDLAAEKTNLNILVKLTTDDNFSIADIAVVDIKIDDSKLKIEKLKMKNSQRGKKSGPKQQYKFVRAQMTETHHRQSLTATRPGKRHPSCWSGKWAKCPTYKCQSTCPRRRRHQRKRAQEKSEASTVKAKSRNGVWSESRK